jgi:hypothetical protein
MRESITLPYTYTYTNTSPKTDLGVEARVLHGQHPGVLIRVVVVRVPPPGGRHEAPACHRVKHIIVCEPPSIHTPTSTLTRTCGPVEADGVLDPAVLPQLGPHERVHALGRRAHAQVQRHRVVPGVGLDRNG